MAGTCLLPDEQSFSSCPGDADVASRPKGHHVKVKIAQQLRRQTPMSRQWIADRLRIGSASYISNLLSSVDSKL
jgi:hypothetical protein